MLRVLPLRTEMEQCTYPYTTDQNDFAGQCGAKIKDRCFVHYSATGSIIYTQKCIKEYTQDYWHARASTPAEHSNPNPENSVF